MNEQDAYEEAEFTIESVYANLEGSADAQAYSEQNGIGSLNILTISSYFNALQEIHALWRKIKGLTVVEIGAGVGMLAIQMAKFAKRVYAIEADPAWSWVFTQQLYRIKPPNLTFIFGRAQELVGLIHADVAVVYTRSDVAGMREMASQFAPEVIIGPLVDFEKRHNIDTHQLQFVMRVADRLGTDGFGLRGFKQADIDAAIRAEAELDPKAAILAGVLRP